MRTLLRARAIENGCFAAACTIAGSEWAGEFFAGAGNHIYDPHGEPVRTPDDHLYELDRARLEGLVVDPAKGFRHIPGVVVYD